MLFILSNAVASRKKVWETIRAQGKHVVVITRNFEDCEFLKEHTTRVHVSLSPNRRKYILNAVSTPKGYTLVNRFEVNCDELAEMLDNFKISWAHCMGIKHPKEQWIKREGMRWLRYCSMSSGANTTKTGRRQPPSALKVFGGEDCEVYALERSNTSGWVRVS